MSEKRLRCSSLFLACWAALISGLISSVSFAEAPLAPTGITAADHPWDSGHKIDLTVQIPKQAHPDQIVYRIERSGSFNGLYTQIEQIKPTPEQLEAGAFTVQIPDCLREVPYWFRVAAFNAEGERSEFVKLAESKPAIATRQIFDEAKIWLFWMALVICGGIMLFIGLARLGMPLKVRKIVGLDAIEEAVGRATEMGRPCLFVPGIEDMNQMQTIAGLTLLSRVAEKAAEYDCELETPTSKSLVMTAARETVANAFLAAGRPEAYRQDLIYYVTDEQFAYVTFITGKMVREKPAACFYLGSFYAESLILAETGNAVGAIQIAGTAQPAQLPFFVAACDYTLIGEEFFAASAYLSKDPVQLGSLKGQDFCKSIVVALMLIGVGLFTFGNLTQNAVALEWGNFLRNTVFNG